MTQGFQDQCPMLWISDLLTIPNHPLVSKAFLFRGIRIKEVTIFGLITNVERMKSAVTLNVDDGTGVILCAYDETYAETHHKEETIRLLDFCRDHENTNQGSNVALLWMLERAIDVYDQDYALQEGDSVYVIGVMSQCTEELRIVTVSFICPLRDLKAEIIMMELRSRFYKSVSQKREKLELVGSCFSVSNSCEISTNSDNSDIDRENDSNSFEAMKSSSRQDMAYSYMGEWHEEYFIHIKEDDCHEEGGFDNLIPD